MMLKKLLRIILLGPFNLFTGVEGAETGTGNGTQTGEGTVGGQVGANGGNNGTQVGGGNQNNSGNQGGGSHNNNPGNEQVFSKDYVQSLRAESASYRVERNAFKKILTGILGIQDGEEITDAKVKTYTDAQAAAVTGATAKAKTLLAKAELKTFTGIDQKLAEKLIDWSKIQVDDNGAIAYMKDGKAAGGMKEALAELATEYPAIGKIEGNAAAAGTQGTGNQGTGFNTGNAGGANPAQGGNALTLQQQYEEAIKAKNFTLAISIKNQMFEKK